MDLMTDAVIAYKRQILQRIQDPPLPSGNVLKDDDVQKWLARNIFSENVAEELGASFLKKQLDRVITAIENAVVDPHEEEVSTELYDLRSKLPNLAAKEQEQGIEHQKKNLIRYHPPTDFREQEQYIQILEKPLVIGSGSDTGNRTWEASLRLMHFLCSAPELVKNRTILELGAGSGLLSIFCAAVLEAKEVLATDFSPQILEALHENVRRNSNYWSSERRAPIIRQVDFFDDLPTMIRDLKDDNGRPIIPDIILGADLVYDKDLARNLGRNLQAAARELKCIDVIIASTERNTNSLNIFEAELDLDRGDFERIDFPAPGFHHQRGLYHALATGIRLYATKSLGYKK